MLQVAFLPTPHICSDYNNNQVLCTGLGFGVLTKQRQVPLVNMIGFLHRFGDVEMKQGQLSVPDWRAKGQCGESVWTVKT